MNTKFKTILKLAVPSVLLCMAYLFTSTNSISALPDSNEQEDITKKKYKLLWQDDFDGPNLNTDIWSLITRGKARWRKHMTTNPNLYQISDGFIRLFCKNNNGIVHNDTARVLTGGIVTQKDYLISGYGKVEVRARMKSVEGCWPAIWIATENYLQEDPRWGEIDVMEHYNLENTIEMTTHNHYTFVKKAQKWPEHQKKVAVKTDEWNVYAVEILKDKIILSINGKEQFVYKNLKIHGQFPYSAPSTLRIDMQWDTKRAKYLDTKSLPAWIDVDWVRVFRLK